MHSQISLYYQNIFYIIIILDSKIPFPSLPFPPSLNSSSLPLCRKQILKVFIINFIVKMTAEIFINTDSAY